MRFTLQRPDRQSGMKEPPHRGMDVGLPTMAVREGISIEFKSDKGPLSDDGVVAAVICLANSEGGELYLGVEDDGRVTGVAPNHMNTAALSAMVASRTHPRLTVATMLERVQGVPVMRFQVPQALLPTMRSDGLYQRRQLKKDGTPECVPMQPHEIVSRGFGALQPDPSEATVPGSTPDDLDPIERERLRRMIQQNPRADQALLDLEDEEIDAFLGLTREHQGTMASTVLGLLLIGREPALSRLLPTHEVAIQFFRGTTLLINEHLREPLLRIIDRLDQLYTLQPAEGEMSIGLQRISVPSVDRDAFREATINAFAHRDYAVRETTVVRWDDDEVEISSPGGLVSGVTVDNLLTVASSPRNQRLAAALKSLGLVERSARGVDRIYEGQARYGRRLPDYGLTNRDRVVVQLDRGPADLEFTRSLIEYERSQGMRLSIRQTLVLAGLRRSRRLSLSDIAADLQVQENRARTVVDALIALDLVASHGRTRARFYTLGPAFLKLLDDAAPIASYVTPTDDEQESRIVSLVEENGKITRSEVVQGLGLTEDQAKHRLRIMVEKQLLERRGERRGAHYVFPRTEVPDSG